MNINMIVNVVLMIFGLYVFIISLLRVIRNDYRPLIIIAMSGLLLCISAFASFKLIPFSNFLYILPLISLLIFNIKYGKDWRDRGKDIVLGEKDTKDTKIIK